MMKVSPQLQEQEVPEIASINIQLQYGYERYKQFPMTRTHVYFQRRREIFTNSAIVLL